MRRWFLSYNSQDLGLVETLERALRRKDPGAKVFFAPKRLRVGGFWLPELAGEIAEATAFVLLVGEKGIGPWQAIEYYEALDRRVKQHDFPVVLLLLDGQPAPGLPFLRQLHWVITADPTSEKSLAQVMDAAAGGGATPGELWRHTAPYRGLYAMTESDADYFLGRGSEIAEVIGALAATPDKLPILVGNSGVGKSSLAQAGVLAALMRQAWPETAEALGEWPHAFNESRRWCFLRLWPGTEPVRALVEAFLWTWQFDAVDPLRAELLNSWVSKLVDDKVTLRDLLDATEARYRDVLHQPQPPAFLLYIDQGEELYVRAEERKRRRFSELVARGFCDSRLRAMMSMRADFFGDLMKDEALYTVHRLVKVPPLREAQLGEVVNRPAELLSARFEPEELAASIVHRTAEESTRDAGALPLLSYLLDDMWTAMVRRGDGTLRMPMQAIELGGVLVGRANAFLAAHPKSEDDLRRIFTLKLATVREGEEPTRRRALRSEFSNEEWRLVSELADHPNRLLITASIETDENAIASEPKTEAGFGSMTDQTYAEVAHEAIFRRWDKLRQWIAAEREFLAWRSGLEAARRSWNSTPGSSKNDALLMGVALARAQTWVSKRAEDLSNADKEFIELSIARDRKARGRTRQIQSVIAVLIIGIVAGVAYAGWSTRSYLKMHVNILADMIWPKVLTPTSEGALKAKDVFKECSHCPEMIVIPGGEFTMGSPASEPGRFGNEKPQHKVTIKAFAVSKFELTFEHWEVCYFLRGCARHPWDQDWGGGSSPVISVSWDDAQQYVAWLSKLTAKAYRLLSEAEWEYAARAGSNSAYAWGDNVGSGNANCSGCGSQWGGRRTAPVGSFAANAFGLFDMSGNVWEWVQDCYQDSYDQAPIDGSVRTSKNCTNRVIRGGSWNDQPPLLRSANRSGVAASYQDNAVGFRVARTLGP
jgi:formylglycine-generating enzyme required for sulfatase activity